MPNVSTFKMATSVLKLLPVLPTVFASLVVFLLPVNKDDNSANHTINGFNKLLNKFNIRSKCTLKIIFAQKTKCTESESAAFLIRVT